MLILAIDPGPELSAYVVYDGTRVIEKGKVPNLEMLQIIRCDLIKTNYDQLVIEQIASYGMPVGFEVFETCVWTGRFIERHERALATHRITRNVVKNHLCHSSKAKDANIRQALVDRFGGKEKAIGKKAAPGPLFGIAGDEWAALAVAVTWWDTNRGKVAA